MHLLPFAGEKVMGGTPMLPGFIGSEKMGERADADALSVLADFNPEIIILDGVFVPSEKVLKFLGQLFVRVSFGEECLARTFFLRFLCKAD